MPMASSIICARTCAVRTWLHACTAINLVYTQLSVTASLQVLECRALSYCKSTSSRVQGTLSAGLIVVFWTTFST